MYYYYIILLIFIIYFYLVKKIIINEFKILFERIYFTKIHSRHLLCYIIIYNSFHPAIAGAIYWSFRLLAIIILLCIT